MADSKFIYGKDTTDSVVSVEMGRPQHFRVFFKNGDLTSSKEIYAEQWILYHQYVEGARELKGNMHYKWAVKYSDNKKYQWAKVQAKRNNVDHFVVYNPKEAFMIQSGVTYYKNSHPSDLKVVSFDIETTGLTHNKDSSVLLISTTWQHKDKKGSSVFKVSDYESQKEMIDDWCTHIREIDPDIICGHNIFGFDLPYLRHCTSGELNLGRDGSPAKFAKYTSKFRRDGSQDYDYNNVLVYGRELIDTFHLSIKYDIGRKYPSYALKQIIEAEGLEKEGRIKWDFDKYPPSEIIKAYEAGNHLLWESFVEYCEDDAEDSLALFNLMIPAFFYYAQSIPKTMQQIINSASGSQINAFLLRSYLSEGHSIPKATEAERYQGAISYGNPGIYKEVQKFDVASLYPSIMLEYKIQNDTKDPCGYMLKMVETFTNERLKNKQLAKETGERHYKDLESAQKIIINSAYGFMGAPGLNFNYPEGAAEVTARGRDILNTAIEWAESKGYAIVNVDTDSISYTNGLQRHEGHFERDLDELNRLYPDRIRWEDDGLFKRVIVVKAKNYVLQDDTGKVTIKGSGLKATMKEPALKKFIKDVIQAMLEERNGDIGSIYMDCIRNILAIDRHNISEWCSKKTVTKAVLNPGRPNEARIKEAIGSKKVQEGDKIKVFFDTTKSLRLLENFDGKYCEKTLLKKAYKTLQIFEPVFNISFLPNYSLRRHAIELADIRYALESAVGRQTTFQPLLVQKFR